VHFFGEQMAKVYVVTVAGMDWQSILHICISEETARKRFEEVREKLLAEAIRMQKFSEERNIRKHRNSDDLYADAIEMHQNTTFDDQLANMHEHVICETYTLEE
jgi:hypothetical protein